MSGLDALHLLEIAVRPALRAMGTDYSTTAAEQLVLGTAAVESNFVWLRQHGHGPALGLWQMEPFTFNDLVKRYPAWMMREGADVEVPCEPSVVAWNLRLGSIMCRLKYRDDPHPLPEPGDVAALADTWKRCYNSRLGAGKPEDFVRAWEQFIASRRLEMWP